MITTRCGTEARPLGLAARPHQDPKCTGRAFRGGINYFFFYGPGQTDFIDGLRPIVARRRDEVILACGGGSRKPAGLRTARRKIVRAVGTDVVDVFFAEYIHPGDDPQAIFGPGGVLDELAQWKSDGLIRYAGASAHDRTIARRLAEDPRIDVLMHRFNMAHRKAADEVFPSAVRAGTPVVAFTATRWGSLLEPQPNWDGDVPTAADCYRYCLAQPAVKLVLTAPRTLKELDANLSVLESGPMSRRDCRRWEHYGDAVYGHERHAGSFESKWP